MSAAQHSPGPWKVSADSDETMNPAFFVTESNTTDWPSIVAEVNSEANANLIRAAPDMIDALRQWANAEATADEVELQNARASRDEAIAKALGQI